MLAGRVVVHGTTEGIEGVSLSVSAGMRTLAEAKTGQTGTFIISDLPEATLNVYVAARGFVQRRFRVPVSAEGDELLIELREPSTGAEKVEISGVTVSIAEETELTLSSGDELSVSQYIDHAGEQIRTVTGDVGTLTELWRDPEKRRLLRAQLRSGDVDPAILGVLLARPDADEYDLLAHAGYQQPIRTREERARALEHTDDTFLASFSDEQRNIVEALLDKYRAAGVEEIATGEVFTAPPFASEFGGIRRLIQLFGGPSALADTLRAIQSHLYGESEAA